MSIADSTSRKASISRKTRETSISVELVLDGSGTAEINTGIGFLDHMLEQLARHSLFDLKLDAAGDLHIDAHHMVEDCGWAVGAALAEALGDRSGISRYGSCLLPMDEALSRVALDLSGRPWLVWHVPMTAPSLGSLETETLREFFQAFAQAGGITLHVETLHGSNSHHMIEACFKATARALRQAAAIDPHQQGRINSTKGVLGGSL